MTATIDKVYHYLRRALTPSYGDFEAFEDGLQEGAIRAWKDIESGKYTEEHIMHRAKLWSRSYLTKGKSSATGQPKRSQTGYIDSQYAVKLEKARGYVESFLDLHNRYPSGREVGEALGFSRSSAESCMRHIKEGHPAVNKVTDETYRTLSLTALSEAQDSASGDNTIHLIETSEPSHENSIMEHYGFMELINKIPEPGRSILFCYYYLDWKAEEIGQYFAEGKLINPRQVGHNRRYRAEERLRKALDASS